MKPSGRRALTALAVAAACFAPFPARAEAPMATAPEACIFYAAPYHGQVDCDTESHLFLMANSNCIRAFDTQTGVQRWHYVLASSRDWVHFYGKTAVITMENTLTVLDKKTGKEKRAASGERYGTLVHVYLTDDEEGMLVSYDPPTEKNAPNAPPQPFTYVLYRFDNSRPHVYRNLQDAFCAGWLADGKSAVFFRFKGENKPAHSLWDDHGLKEFFLYDLETGAATEPHVIPESDRALWVSVSPSGLLAVTKLPRQKGPIGLRIFDARTGALVRDLGEREEAFTNVEWTRDGKSLYFTQLDDTEKKVWVIDAQTGKTRNTFSQPEQEIFQVHAQQPGQGPGMVLTQDKDQNFWCSPLAGDDAPVKVFDGHMIAPAQGMRFEGNQYLSALTRDSNTAQLGLWQIEDMQKLGKWRMAGPHFDMMSWFNRAMTHCVDRTFDPQGSGKAQNNRFEIYARDQEQPVFSSVGNPLALSPDGRFVVAQIDGKRGILEDIQEERVVQVFDAVLDWDAMMEAAFSDDGRRVAVYAHPNLEVVDL